MLGSDLLVILVLALFPDVVGGGLTPYDVIAGVIHLLIDGRVVLMASQFVLVNVSPK